MTHWNFIRIQHGWQATNLTSGKAWMLHDGDVLSYEKYVLRLFAGGNEKFFVVISEETARDALAEALEGQKQ